MLGFGLQKLIVLAVVIAVVWYGFRWVSRYQRVRQKEEADSIPRRPRRTRRRVRDKPEELARCHKCGAFVPLNAPHDCP